MQVVFIIALCVGLLIGLIFLIKSWLFSRFIVKQFERCNCIVDGKKGTGKDLLFDYVIAKRKKHYYSNVPYGGEHSPIICKDITIAPNTYDNFIDGETFYTDRRFTEGDDVYISDGGVFLPSYADSKLHKSYVSMPLAYPLSRHLWKGNIHVNIQNFDRLWKPLREQADFWIHVTHNVSFFGFLLVHAVTYDRKQSAEQYLSPVKNRLFNKYDKAEKDIYKATNGEIKSGWIFIRKRNIDYDTRAFEKVIYGDSPRLIWSYRLHAPIEEWEKHLIKQDLKLSWLAAKPSGQPRLPR